MAFRINLSDGVTTANLYDGSSAQVRVGGLNMPPPTIDAMYIGNPEYDGDRLARARYRNRTIDIRTKIWGTSLSDLKTNIRTIQRLLNDAEERNLLGYGGTVHLEYQWGDTAGQSVFFDVHRGDLTMPADYLNQILSNSFCVSDARLILECKPFGRYANQDETQAAIENCDFGGSTNYQDVTTAASYGDVPAKMYWKMSMANATGDKKIWLAKRSGSRQTDDLWIEGEDEDSSTDGTAYSGCFPTYTYTDETLAAASGGKFRRLVFSYTTADCNTSVSNAIVARHNYTIATVPKGQFRVLILCKGTSAYLDYWNRIAWGFGWTYGDKTYTPTLAKGEYHVCAVDDTWEILDLGVLNLPPIAESDIATNNSLELRIFMCGKGTLQSTNNHAWDLDYIFLLPVDEGVVIIDTVGATDVLAVDGITDPPNVFILNTGGTITDYPDYVGKPFDLGRENTRLYVLRNDGGSVTFTSDVKYQPQFLTI